MVSSSIRSFTWWGRIGEDVVLVVLALAGQTNSATTLDLSIPANLWRQTDRQTGHFTGPWTVERRDGPSWLRDDDDDDDMQHFTARKLD